METIANQQQRTGMELYRAMSGIRPWGKADCGKCQVSTFRLVGRGTAKVPAASKPHHPNTARLHTPNLPTHLLGGRSIRIPLAAKLSFQHHFIRRKFTQRKNNILF